MNWLEENECDFYWSGYLDKNLANVSNVSDQYLLSLNQNSLDQKTCVDIPQRYHFILYTARCIKSLDKNKKKWANKKKI